MIATSALILVAGFLTQGGSLMLLFAPLWKGSTPGRRHGGNSPPAGPAECGLVYICARLAAASECLGRSESERVAATRAALSRTGLPGCWEA
jgi:hypothetical protein